MEVDHIVFQRLKFDKEEVMMYSDNQTKNSKSIPNGLTMEYKKSNTFQINIKS